MNLPDDEKYIEKIGKMIALFILIAASFIICSMLYTALTTEEHPPHALSDYHKAKIERYCMERGVRPEVIEIESSGRMTYMLNGQRCEIR